MYTIVKYDSREEWLEGRKKGIGSSDVGTILGINHFSTPLRLWRRRMGLDPVPPQSAAMARGHRLEVVVANDFSQATGAFVDPSSSDDWHAVDNDRPWLRVSPDRLYWDASTPEAERDMGNVRILECKTCSVPVTPESVFEQYPYWYAQLQYQMGVMGVSKGALGWIVVTDSDLPFGYVDVDFNPRYYYNMMVPALDAFWLDNIVGGAEPDQVLDSEDAILKWERAREGGKAVASDELAAEIEHCRMIESEMKALEKETDEIKLHVRTAMKDCESLVLPDGKTEVATWKMCSTAGRLDSKRLKEEQPDMWSEYFLPGGETRRLVLKAPKALRA